MAPQATLKCCACPRLLCTNTFPRQYRQRKHTMAYRYACVVRNLVTLGLAAGLRSCNRSARNHPVFRCCLGHGAVNTRSHQLFWGSGRLMSRTLRKHVRLFRAGALRPLRLATMSYGIDDPGGTTIRARSHIVGLFIQYVGIYCRNGVLISCQSCRIGKQRRTV